MGERELSYGEWKAWCIHDSAPGTDRGWGMKIFYLQASNKPEMKLPADPELSRAVTEMGISDAVRVTFVVSGDVLTL